MRDVTIWRLRDLLTTSTSVERQIRPGVWAPARPMGYPSLRHRLRATWLVFTGRADALLWPEDVEASDEQGQ